MPTAARSWLALALGAAAVAPLAPPATAQEDFRSADAGRPVRIEDARPLKLYEWEVELGSRGEIEEGARGAEGVLELKAGLFRNVQVGVEVEGAVARGPGDTGAASGLESFAAHALFGVQRETPAVPALAVRVDGSTPGVGDLRHRTAHLGLLALATRSLGRLRVHGNGGFTFAGARDGGDYWRAGVGMDYPVGLFSTAVLADVFFEVPEGGGSTRSWVDVGTRLQVTNRTVVDVGLSTRVDAWRDGTANVGFVLGVSRVFGIPRPGPVYPEPSIR